VHTQIPKIKMACSRLLPDHALAVFPLPFRRYSLHYPLSFFTSSNQHTTWQGWESGILIYKSFDEKQNLVKLFLLNLA